MQVAEPRLRVPRLDEEFEHPRFEAADSVVQQASDVGVAPFVRLLRAQDVSGADL